MIEDRLAIQRLAGGFLIGVGLVLLLLPTFGLPEHLNTSPWALVAIVVGHHWRSAAGLIERLLRLERRIKLLTQDPKHAFARTEPGPAAAERV